MNEDQAAVLKSVIEVGNPDAGTTVTAQPDGAEITISGPLKAPSLSGPGSSAPDAAAGTPQRARPVRQHRGRAGRARRLAQGVQHHQAAPVAGHGLPPRSGSPAPPPESWACRYRPSSRGRASLHRLATTIRTTFPGSHPPFRRMAIRRLTVCWRWNRTAWCRRRGACGWQASRSGSGPR